MLEIQTILQKILQTTDVVSDYYFYLFIDNVMNEYW